MIKQRRNSRAAIGPFQTGLLAIAMLVPCASALAQPARPPAQEIKTTRLAADFYLFEGPGGTVSVLSGPDGVLAVDAQTAPVSKSLLAAIRKATGQPVRFLVNTHIHSDHTGGNENFAKAGALILSRDEVRSRLAQPSPNDDGGFDPPSPPRALPVVTYAGSMTLHLNGQKVELIPIPTAHTDGDTLVYFPAQDALAVGDYFRTAGYPRVDLGSRGTLDGLLAGLDETIRRAGPATRIISGHGPITDRAGVIAQRDLILAVEAKVQALIEQGQTVEQVIAAKPTAEFDARVIDGAATSEQFVRWLYAELKRTG